MAPSSALIIVCVSSSPDASMCVVVFVGEWMTEAPCLGLPSLCEPSVYVHSSGLCMGCQGIGWGGLSYVCLLVVFGLVDGLHRPATQPERRCAEWSLHFYC
jgi:hypothetical protein